MNLFSVSSFTPDPNKDLFMSTCWIRRATTPPQRGQPLPYHSGNEPAALAAAALTGALDPEEARLADQDLADEVRQSLERSPARIMQRGPSRLGLRGGSGGSSSAGSASPERQPGQGSPSQGGGNGNGSDNGSDNVSNYETDEEFPTQYQVFLNALGDVPPEFLLRLQAFLPPIDELLLGHTHPRLFHSDKFSLYRLDADYQMQWQLRGPTYGDERLPLLHHAIKCNAPLAIIPELLNAWEAVGLDL
ncbi:hypothetical protein PG997_001902 [Apiospora hydei]|uniref:Uncharacterized protein n=1 Tax=Apiospora hydei TaxID=1337664 RepID=A0ABR1X7V2_9PEZI